ncbi:MAG: YHS domain-containing protein [Polyangia bacterium]
MKDPICGKDVDTLRARAVAIYGGVTYYFCSADCKAKYTDPRKTVPATAPRETGERRREPQPSTAADDIEPVRYARSRIRRITGEVSSPMVQIDLSPNKKPAPPPADAAGDDVLEPARSGRPWVWIAIVMLLIAGGVIYYTLKHR